MKLSWTTPCDGGIDITGHEYREKVGNGSFGSWTPIPNSAAGEVNATSYTVTGLNNPLEYTFEVRAVNALGEGEISAEALVRNPSVPLSDRTPQVRDGIVAAVPDVSDYRNVTEAHLAAITALLLGHQNITSLKPGDFSGLTALTRLNLTGNQLSSLPNGIFEGLISLTQLRLGGNSVNPLPLTVSLEKVVEGQFKVVVPAGAPFEMVLPLIVTNGSISGGATTITVPAGSVESETFTVIRTPGTSDAVTVELGTLPGLPAGHTGYALVQIGTVSYDSDGDGLIDIGSLRQLNAVRWDLDGDGAVDNDANAAAYAHAFPNAVVGLGCPDNDCTGYELVADLDFDTNGDGTMDAADSYWNDGEGWVPIGSSDNEFIATFEGNGHTIDNLDISRENTPGGLFGVVGIRGQVRNVGVRKVTVYGYGLESAVGGLVGINRGSIVASYATGLVGGEGLAIVGGLVGGNTGSIAASYATAEVKSLDSTVGGLVGAHGPEDGGRAIITASYATGAVLRSRLGDVPVRLGMIQGVGGLVGLKFALANGGRAIITASYATGDVWNDDASNIGGLVGLNVVSDCSDCRGIIAASYATGNVETDGTSNIGGLVGLNLTRGSSNGNIITASYATGAVMGNGNVGGLVGQDSTSLNANSNINNSYWDTETSGQATSAGGTGKTTAELVTPTGYTGIYFNWNLDLDGDSANDNPWDFGTSSEYPVLRVDFDGDGDVDADDIDPQRRVAAPPAVSTDFNGDGRTNFADFFLFVDAFGGTDARFDLNGNGTVDAADFFLFVDAFGS